MTEEQELLQRASNEIKGLRNQNQTMATRLDMFDKCIMLLTANLHSSGQGMSEDIAWKIDKFLEKPNQ